MTGQAGMARRIASALFVTLFFYGAPVTTPLEFFFRPCLRNFTGLTLPFRSARQQSSCSPGLQRQSPAGLSSWSTYVW